MLELLVRFLRWNLRTFWWPTLQLLGRITDQEDRVETFISLTEENLTNSLEKLGGDDDGAS